MPDTQTAYVQSINLYARCLWLGFVTYELEGSNVGPEGYVWIACFV